MTRIKNRIAGQNKSLNLIWCGATALTFFLIVIIFHPFREVFAFDTDEGFNLMKSMLVVRGYPLYTETWSDQPPLFTYSLAAIFRIVGFEVNAGRVFVLTLSSVLIGGAFIFLQQSWSKWHGLAAAILIVLLPHYLTLSVSNMVGLPALAFAVSSLALLATWHEQRKRKWLILSAIILSLAVFTKLFTGFLIPIFLVGVIIGEYKHGGNTNPWIWRLYPAMLWLGTLIGCIFLLGLIFVGAENISQLVIPHLVAKIQSSRNINFDSLPIEWHLREAWAILLLAILGSLIAIIKKKWLTLYLLAWMGVAYLLLRNYSPVWYHHQLIITIPAAMLAGITIGEIVDEIFISKHPNVLPIEMKMLLMSGALISLITLVIRVPVLVDEFNQQPNKRFIESGTLSVNERILKRMASHAEETEWVFTDLPIYPFRVGLKVPPELAVISAKRIFTGTLTDEQILNVLREKRPEQVLLGRFDYPSVNNYIDTNYKLIFNMEDKRLYLRNDL